MKRIGERVRERRKQQNLTLQQLAARTGLSVSFLSQLENGQTSCKIDTLASIGRALDIPILHFFVDDAESNISLVRKSDRRTLLLGESATEDLLFVQDSFNLEVWVLKLPPQTSSGHDNSHEGEEFTYVLKGSVRIWFNSETHYDLQEGDIIYYRSALPHRWENVTDGAAEALVANTPPTF